MILPKSFEHLMNSLTILPGVGEKTAERFVYSIYNNDIQEIENLSEALINFKKNYFYYKLLLKIKKVEDDL